MALLFSCANATCAVPEAFRDLFRGSEDFVESSDGWEPGSLNLAQAFAMKFRTPLVHGDVTRLLIDLDQEGDLRWSRFSSQLPEATRIKLVDRHEKPFRTSLTQRITEDLRRHATVHHLMVHTDPASTGRVVLETFASAPLAEEFGANWCARLRTSDLDVTHRRNGPPGPLAAFLLDAAPPGKYVQLRLTVSQSFFLSGTPWRWETLKKHLIQSLPQESAGP
jgi:hypothetical protein